MLTFVEVLLMTIAGLLLQFLLPFCHSCILKCRRTENYRQRNSRQRAIFTAEIKLEDGIVLKDENDDDIFRADVSVCRLVSLHSFLWMFVWIPCLVLGIIRHINKTDDIALVLLICSCIGLGYSLLCVMFESCYSWELQYIENMFIDGTCVSYLNSLRKVEPSLKITITCWHYETRYRTVRTHDTDGFSSTSRETYEEKVIDKVESEVFKFDGWEDRSVNPEDLHLHPGRLTRVRVVKSVKFRDKRTADRYTEQKNDFYARVQRQNWKHLDLEESETITGHEKRIICNWNSEGESCLINSKCYWIFTVLCCSWLYRLIFNNVTQKTSYKLQKIVFVGDK